MWPHFHVNSEVSKQEIFPVHPTHRREWDLIAGWRGLIPSCSDSSQSQPLFPGPPRLRIWKVVTQTSPKLPGAGDTPTACDTRGCRGGCFPRSCLNPCELRTLFCFDSVCPPCFSVCQPSHTPTHSITSWERAAGGALLQVFWLIIYVCTTTASPAQLVPTYPPDSRHRLLGSDG